jgi:hypothetical protein
MLIKATPEIRQLCAPNHPICIIRRLTTSHGTPASNSMSVFARTPESYAAWQLVKLSSVFRPEERVWAEYEKGKQELDLLFAGTK